MSSSQVPEVRKGHLGWLRPACQAGHGERASGRPLLLRCEPVREEGRRQGLFRAPYRPIVRGIRRPGVTTRAREVVGARCEALLVACVWDVDIARGGRLTGARGAGTSLRWTPSVWPGIAVALRLRTACSTKRLARFFAEGNDLPLPGERVSAWPSNRARGVARHFRVGNGGAPRAVEFD